MKEVRVRQGRESDMGTGGVELASIKDKLCVPMRMTLIWDEIMLSWFELKFGCQRI